MSATCSYCGERPVAKGASRYCEQCAQLGKAESAKAAKRKPCRGCGQPKGNVRPGTSYCESCRELRAPANEMYEQDRARRQVIEREKRLMAGRATVVRKAPGGIPDGQKWCPRCERILPLAHFGKADKKGKVRAYCLPCHRSYCHERHLRNSFGLTPEGYAEMYDAQGGRCAICLRRPRTSRLAVDHNHSTDEIRGLLCYRCNKQILGHAMESPALLRRAANYLEAPPARTRLPLEALDHFEDQAQHGFADDAEHVEDGVVVIDSSGDRVALTYRTMLALAQVAGTVLMVEGQQFDPREQMAADDLVLVESLWRSYQRQIRGAA